MKVKVYWEEHPSIANTCNNIANVLHNKGDYDGALLQYIQALKVQVKVHGEDHHDTAVTHSNIVNVLHNKGGYDAALL